MDALRFHSEILFFRITNQYPTLNPYLELPGILLGVTFRISLIKTSGVLARIELVF